VEVLDQLQRLRRELPVIGTVLVRLASRGDSRNVGPMPIDGGPRHYLGLQLKVSNVYHQGETIMREPKRLTNLSAETPGILRWPSNQHRTRPHAAQLVASRHQPRPLGHSNALRHHTMARRNPLSSWQHGHVLGTNLHLHFRARRCVQLDADRRPISLAPCHRFRPADLPLRVRAAKPRLTKNNRLVAKNESHVTHFERRASRSG
jgi:hypothetical protein